MMMLARFQIAVCTVAICVAGAGVARGSDLRGSHERPDVIEIGDPILMSRALLDREARRNTGLANYITLYGLPDYAEVQELRVPDPLAGYEVRLYYLKRDVEVAFSRVNVSPAFRTFGLKMYEGAIPQETMARLLTAQGEEAAFETPPPPPAPVAPMDVIKAAPEKAAPEKAAPALSGNGIEDALLRLEAAADRAYLAAEMAERASKTAGQSARRANAILDKMTVAR